MKQKENIINLYRKILLGFFLLFISVFFVFFKQDTIPRGLAHDENELARVTFSLENKPYTPFTPVADGHGTPYFYTLLSSFNIFGINTFALRFPNRIIGIVTIVVFYCILLIVFKDKKKWTDIISFFLALILLTSRWYLNFVRFSFEMPFLLSLELLSLLCIFLFQKNKRIFFLIASGLFAGLAFNSYQPGRIFFLIPLLFLFINKNKARSYIIYMITFLIFIAPISLYLTFNPQNDIRINQQLFIKNTSLSVIEKATYFGSNILSTTFMFFWKGDMNGRHNYTGKPAINPILFIMFIFGLYQSFHNKKTKESIIFLFYFIIAILPTVFTYPWENPNMLRTFTSLPSLVYFIGQGCFFIISFAQSIKYKRVLIGFIIFFVLISSIYEIRTYFIYQPLVFKQAFDKPDYLPIIRSNALKQTK